MHVPSLLTTGAQCSMDYPEAQFMRTPRRKVVSKDAVNWYIICRVLELKDKRNSIGEWLMSNR